MIRFKAMPKFDFQIINRIDQPVLGAGEVLITNAAAAIANAVFDATGKSGCGKCRSPRPASGPRSQPDIPLHKARKSSGNSGLFSMR